MQTIASYLFRIGELAVADGGPNPLDFTFVQDTSPDLFVVERIYISKEQIQNLEAGGTNVAGYMNVGKVVAERSYYDPALGPDKSFADFDSPGWLAAMKTEVEELLAQGFDTIYFDDILAYADSTTDAAQQSANALDMIQLVNGVVAHARTINPEAEFIYNGAPYIRGDAGLAVTDEAWKTYRDAADVVLADNYLKDFLAGTNNFQKAVDEFVNSQFIAIADESVLATLGTLGTASYFQRVAISNGFVPLVAPKGYTQERPANLETFPFGTLGSDWLAGDSGDNTLDGNGGWDVILGGTGNDNLTGGDIPGRDFADLMMSGGGGNDTLTGFLNDDLITGGIGEDSAMGSAGKDTVAGGDGNDFVDGGTDKDVLFGDDGNDVVMGDEGADTMRGGADMDTMDGGSGDDLIFGGNVFNDNNDSADVINGGGAGSDTIIGGAGDDSLSGGDETFAGVIVGDLIFGNSGNDTIHGGTGDDELRGGLNDDLIRGEDGNDTLLGEAGRDTMFGGAGNDSLMGGWFNDVMFGEAGNDTLFGEGGYDVLHGGAGSDYLFGGALADWLYGGANDDTLAGGSGKDRMFGGQGDDELEGGEGNDTLFGAAGRDAIVGGSGNDLLNGEADGDTFVFRYGFGDDTITDFDALDDTEIISFFAWVEPISNDTISTYLELLSFITTSQVGSDVVIDTLDGRITLLNTQMSDLDAADFGF